MVKIAILASSNGSNFQAIIQYFQHKLYNIDFTLITNNPNAFAIQRAKKLNINYFFINHHSLDSFLLQHTFDLIVLAGYNRILSKQIVNSNTIINIHPSLLPNYKGLNAIKRCFDNQETNLGVTIHFVNQYLDNGPIIAQQKLNLPKNLDFYSFEQKFHQLEHKLYPKTIELLLKKLFPHHLKTKFNTLIIGCGAREHALAWKISQSKHLNKLFLFGANDGFSHLGENIEKNFKYSFNQLFSTSYDNTYNFELFAQTLLKKNIDLCIIGPEHPLALGLVDVLQKYNINSIGFNKYFSNLEASKIFAKHFCQKYNIDTPSFKTFDQSDNIDDFDHINFKPPFVLKADGLAFGKGVIIEQSKHLAKKYLQNMLNGQFGKASNKVLVENFETGQEFSLIYLWDSNTLLPFILAKDYKKLHKNSNINTGGMGSFCYNPKDPILIKLLHSFSQKLSLALKQEQANFKAILYAGLIFTKAKKLKLLEFNVRFGDPEIQSLLMNLENDLLFIFIKMIQGKLHEINLKFKLKEKNHNSYCVVIASEGYPNQPKTNTLYEIKNIHKLKKKYGVELFFASIKKQHNSFFTTNSTRVLSVCKTGKNKKATLNSIYNFCNYIDFDKKIFRKDIAKNENC